MNALLISILAVAVVSGVVAAEPVVAPQTLIGFQRAVIQKRLGEPSQSGEFKGGIDADVFAERGITAIYDQLGAVYWLLLTKPRGGEPPELFGVTVSATFDECVAELGEPQSVAEDQASGFLVPQWIVGKFKVSGEFWLEAGDGHKKGEANSLSVTRAAK